MRDYQKYSRPPYNPSNNALKWLIIANVAAFILQSVTLVWFKSPILERFGALSYSTLSQGYAWTLVSYSFLHGSFFHILINMLVIFFIGRILEPLLGTKKFLQIYFFAAVMGGLLWLSLNHGAKEILVGASGSGFGLMTVFCLTQPNQPITLLLFFVIPITIKPKWLLTILISVELFFLIFYELQNRSAIASSAHLGGILAGFISYYLMSSNPTSGLSKMKVETPKWVKNKIIHKAYNTKYKVNVSQPQVIKEEVDRILDKINTQGFGSLSPEEKKTLDRAKDILNR